MKKRFLLAAVMAMCMMVMVMPAAFAEGGTYESDEAAISDNKVFRIGEEGTDGAYYATLGDAVAAVQEGESTPTTIVLLKDASGGGVSINNKNIIFDFGGHTYTVGEPTVGSAGTETNGFQLLRGSTIKMTNGTLKASNYPNLKIMIQNYCDLTLEDVNLDASEALQCQYVASNNCGEVEIIGSTNITAASGQVAFDVCWWPTSYSEGVQVTINTTGNITGNIELGTYGSLTGHEISASTLTIEQGTFSGEIEVSTELETQATEKISISGGTFTHADVSAYLVDTVKQDSTGQVRPLAAEDSESVARIRETYYRSLQAAIDDAENGETVTLVRTSTDNSSIVIDDGRSLTLNMNGCDVGFAKNQNISIYHGGLNITGKGKLYEKEPYFAPIMLYGSNNAGDANYTTVTVGKDVTLEGWSGLFIDKLNANNGGANAFGIVATVNGTLHSVKDTAGAGGHALYINGTIKATEGNVPRIILDGATLNTDDGNGMYLAGYADTTITDSTITSTSNGSTGIEIRAGKLEITNSAVSGGTGKYTGAPNGNGSTSFNVGLAVAQHTTKLPIEVTVNSGTFTGGAAFVQSNPQKNDAESIEKVALSIAGGSFEGQIYSENKTEFISGGTFDTDVIEYVADGKFSIGSDGEFVVKDGTASQLVTDLGTQSIPAGQAVEFTFSTIANSHAGKMVVGTFSRDPSVSGKLEYYEVKDGNWYELTGDSFGPAGGFPMADATSRFRVTFDTAGDYTFTVSMKLAGSDTVLCSTEVKVNVIAADKVPSELTTDIGEKSFTVGQPTEFTFTTTANDQKDTMVIGTATFSDPDAIEKLEYYEVQDGNWYELTGDFGPAGGFPLSDATSRFRVTFKEAGNYSFTASIKAVSGGAVLCSVSETVTVSEPYTPPVNPTYTITNPSVTGGTVTVSPRSASRGRLVTITVTPDEGYELASLTVTDSRGNTVTLTDAGNGKYTFTMPGSRVVVNAAFQLASLPFTDVAEGAWYYDAVAYVYRNGLMAGVSSTQFAPDSTLNRATLATILWRLAGEPVVNYVLPFEDVAEGEWYSEAIRWAASTGIVNGTTPTTFRPFNSVTREQMAAMVHRYAEYMGYDTTASTDLGAFTDAASVNSYAAEPMGWCVAEGLISGIGTEIRPQSSATRAQIATMLMRFCENIAK